MAAEACPKCSLGSKSHAFFRYMTTSGWRWPWHIAPSQNHSLTHSHDLNPILRPEISSLLGRSLLASLELLEVPVADLHVSIVVVHALGEALGAPAQLLVYWSLLAAALVCWGAASAGALEPPLKRPPMAWPMVEPTATPLGGG